MVEREGVRGQQRGKGACMGVRVRAQERRGRMCTCGGEGGRVRAVEREGAKRRAKEGVRERRWWRGRAQAREGVCRRWRGNGASGDGGGGNVLVSRVKGWREWIHT